MDNNACPQRIALIQSYVKSEEIAGMEWPAYFNPIENLWDNLGCVVCTRLQLPIIVKEFETVLLEEWWLLVSTLADPS